MEPLVLAESGMAATRRKSVRTSVVLPEDDFDRVTTIASANGVSTAWVIRTAIARFLDQQGDQIELPLRLPGRSEDARK